MIPSGRRRLHRHEERDEPFLSVSPAKLNQPITPSRTAGDASPRRLPRTWPHLQTPEAEEEAPAQAQQEEERQAERQRQQPQQSAPRPNRFAGGSNGPRSRPASASAMMHAGLPQVHRLDVVASLSEGLSRSRAALRPSSAMPAASPSRLVRSTSSSLASASSLWRERRFGAVAEGEQVGPGHLSALRRVRSASAAGASLWKPTGTPPAGSPHQPAILAAQRSFCHAQRVARGLPRSDGAMIAAASGANRGCRGGGASHVDGANVTLGRSAGALGGSGSASGYAGAAVPMAPCGPAQPPLPRVASAPALRGRSQPSGPGGGDGGRASSAGGGAGGVLSMSSAGGGSSVLSAPGKAHAPARMQAMPSASNMPGTRQHTAPVAPVLRHSVSSAEAAARRCVPTHHHLTITSPSPHHHLDAPSPCPRRAHSAMRAYRPILSARALPLAPEHTFSLRATGRPTSAQRAACSGCWRTIAVPKWVSCRWRKPRRSHCAVCLRSPHSPTTRYCGWCAWDHRTEITRRPAACRRHAAPHELRSPPIAS